MPRDYYEVLGVGRDAGPDEIKRAYRRMAMQHHPDRNSGDKSAEEAFKEASEAYGVLGDQEKRARYDRFGHAGVRGAAGGPQIDPSIFEEFGFGGIFENLLNLSDLFGGGTGARRPTGPPPGRDVAYDLEVDFDEPSRDMEKRILVSRAEPCDGCGGTGGANGAPLEVCADCGGRGQEVISRGFVVMKRPCSGCGGRGRRIGDPCRSCGGAGRERREREITVKLPAGIDDGNRIRLSGQGDAGANGGPRGDLYVDVSIRPRDGWDRDGADAHSELWLSFPQAALGDRVPVRTLWGSETVSVPAGTRHGDAFRLRGKGFPHLRGRGRGDHHVHARIDVPKKLSRDARRKVKDLAEDLRPPAPSDDEDGQAAPATGRNGRAPKSFFGWSSSSS